MKSQRERDLRAHELAEAFELHDGLARMLSALATYSDAECCVRASVATLSRRAGRAKRTGELLLSQLEELGIIETRRRGRGVAERFVNFEAEPSHQLDLFAPNAASTDRPNPQSATRSATAQPATAVCAQSATQVADEVVKLTTEEEDAREPIPSVTGLASTLSRVVEVLGTAPGLLVEELSVNAILQGHPERDGYDHERAAWTVTSWAHEGGLSMSSAPRLLQRALLKQRDAHPAGERPRHATSRREPVAAAAGGRDFSRFKRSAGW